MSCQPWSSVEVTYVHPPHVNDRKTPTPATNFGSVELALRVKMYQRATNANRGPEIPFSECQISAVFEYTHLK
jgi:hypothetical protein